MEEQAVTRTRGKGGAGAWAGKAGRVIVVSCPQCIIGHSLVSLDPKVKAGRLH